MSIPFPNHIPWLGIIPFSQWHLFQVHKSYWLCQCCHGQDDQCRSPLQARIHSHAVVKHTISSRVIKRIELDQNSKPEFCKACAKAKAIIPKVVSHPCYEVWRICPLGPLGSCISSESKWKPLCCSLYWQSHMWNCPILPKRVEWDINTMKHTLRDRLEIMSKYYAQTKVEKSCKR